MRISINVSDLVDALSTVTHALSPRSTLPILDGVLLDAYKNELHLTCSDGALTISTTIDAAVEESGYCVMPGRLFGDVARKLPAGAQLTISVSNGQIATLRCAGSRTTIAGKPGDQFPRTPEIDEQSRVTLPQSALRDMITRTSFAVSVDETRKILTGCLLEVKDGESRMVALDGYRLAVRIVPIEGADGDLSAVIPGRVLTELSKIVDGGEEDMATLRFGKTQLMVSAGRTVVYATLLEGEFINYRQIIPSAFKTTVRVLDREQLLLCIERASLMARESKTNLVKLSVSKDQIVITSNSELGDAYEEIQTESEGDELDIAFNVKYLSDVVRAVDSDEFLFCFNSGVSPCVVRPVEGSDYTYMVLPVRINA